MSRQKWVRGVLGIVMSVGYAYAFWMMWDRRPETFRSVSLLTEPLLVQADEIELLYDEDGRTMEDRGEGYNCDAVINGSYFSYDDDGKYIPAGVWHLGDDIRPHAAPEDPNLQYIVSFTRNKNTGIIESYAAGDNVHIDPRYARFSAGPLLLDRGINPVISQDISHRQGRYMRTVLLLDEDMEMSFGLFPQKVTLIEAADKLYEDGVVQAINLDGGPSTAYWSRSRPQDNIRPRARLPIVFCLKD